MWRPSLFPSEGSSVSNAVIRRIAASKKTLAGT
ncbi:lytic transglycosylase domain-containing protein, partial [Streptomyces sp. WAC07149]